TLATGGILVTSNVGPNSVTIAGGTLSAVSSGTSKQASLVLHQHNTDPGGTVTISSSIVNPNPQAITPTGATTNASATITLSGGSGTTGLVVGMGIAGNNIPANSFIKSIPNAT